LLEDHILLNGSEILYTKEAETFAHNHKSCSSFSGFLLETPKVWHGSWREEMEPVRKQPQDTQALKPSGHIWESRSIFLSGGGALW